VWTGRTAQIEIRFTVERLKKPTIARLFGWISPVVAACSSPDIPPVTSPVLSPDIRVKKGTLPPPRFVRSASAEIPSQQGITGNFAGRR
jgi:hypothetical protein